MKKLNTLCAILTLALSSIAASAFGAPGMILDPAELPPETRALFSSQIETERTRVPASFETLRDLHSRIEHIDNSKRGRMAPFTPLLKRMGKDALMPMLELAAFDAPARGALSDSAWIGFRVGLLEALGHQRDPQLRPLFEAVLDGTITEAYVVRAAAAGLAALGDDVSLNALLSRANVKGIKQTAIWSGMGHCRREAAASFLAQRLSETTSGATARALIKSLGEVGNAWAWKTSSVRVHQGEETIVRTSAAKALVDAYLRFDGETRDNASNALMVVDAPSTPQHIEAARGQASAAQIDALDALASRFDRNPTRR